MTRYPAQRFASCLPDRLVESKPPDGGARGAPASDRRSRLAAVAGALAYAALFFKACARDAGEGLRRQAIAAAAPRSLQGVSSPCDKAVAATPRCLSRPPVLCCGPSELVRKRRWPAGERVATGVRPLQLTQMGRRPM